MAIMQSKKYFYKAGQAPAGYLESEISEWANEIEKTLPAQLREK